MDDNRKPQSPIAWVLGQTGDHSGQYVLSVILAVIGVAFSVAPYFVVVGIVQGLMEGRQDFSFYLTRCLIMAALWLCRILFHSLSTAASHIATFAVLGEIRKRCTEKLTRMPLGAVLTQSSGALKNTLVERIDSIETTLAHIVPEFTANLLVPVIIEIYIFTIDWRMGLASLVTVPVGMFSYALMMLGSGDFYQHTITATKALNDTAVEYINGIQVIKVFGKTKSSYERFVHDAYEAAHSFIDWMRASILPMTFAMVVMPSTMVSVLPIGGILVKNGSLSPQDFVMIIILSVGLITPFVTLMSYSDDLRTMGTIFEAFKIPAIACMVRALLRGSVTSQDILLSLGIMLFSIIGSSLIKARSMMLQTEGGYDTCARKRVEIAEHMRYLPMGYFNEKSLGQITSVTTNVMQNLENVATRVIMMVCEGLLTTSLIIVMLFFFDWRIALVLLAGFGLFLFANRFLQRAAGTMARQKVDSDERVVEKVLEYLQGMAEVKAYHLTGTKSRELNDAVSANVKVNSDMELTLIPRMNAQNLLAKLTGVCMVALSCFFYCEGSMDTLTAVVMVISAFIVYASLETAGNYSALLRVVDVSVSRAQEILDTPQIDITGERITLENRNLAAEDVEFSYEKRKVIDGVTVQIPEKTTTAIVGPSGGGKTTLVNLLARFWDVDAGTVTLGGRNVKDYDMDSLMENFSFVFQNVYLFHDTIADNIRFGQPDAPMEKVIEAAKKACCHDFIEALPDGYDTVIGEGGASLSGGEKQRISIARAMMKDAPVIFLDEATANVDPENENDLMRAIQALTEEKTVIMIAHRLKTVEHADQILVVDHGKIVQQGSHGELMKEEGIYRNFISERREAAGWKVKRQC